jgi:hypothetical protein
MQMPFPGMDPYLEHPLLWPSVHQQLLVWIAHQLAPRLRPRYIASVEQRVFIEEPARPTDPATSAPLIVEAPGLLPEGLEVREAYLEIQDRYRELKVVTAIEVLSPTNKVPGPGRLSYRIKQRQVLNSECHLVEIDLLRQGRHTLAVPEVLARAAAPYDYLVSVNRWPQRERFELYACRLRDRLPSIKLPLAEPDADVPLDLQMPLEQAYDDGSFMLKVRYDDPCQPPLSADDQAWATACWQTYRAAHPELFPPPV